MHFAVEPRAEVWSHAVWSEENPICRPESQSLISRTLTKKLSTLGAVAPALSVSELAQIRPAPSAVLIDAHNVNRSVLVELANEVPNAKIVVMNPDWEGLDVLDCIRIADAGFALMGDPSDRIINIVQSVLEGKPIVPPVIFERIQQQIRRDSRLKSVNGSLTVREQHIFELLLDGSSNQEIANKLNVSLATVKNHVHAILLKLDCRSRHEVFRRFAGSGGALNRRSEWNPGN